MTRRRRGRLLLFLSPDFRPVGLRIRLRHEVDLQRAVRLIRHARSLSKVHGQVLAVVRSQRPAETGNGGCATQDTSGRINLLGPVQVALCGLRILRLLEGHERDLAHATHRLDFPEFAEDLAYVFASSRGPQVVDHEEA